MKFRELLENFQNIDQVIDAYKVENKEEIEQGCVRNFCGGPAYGFAVFARDNGFPEAEYISNGIFKVDIALYDKEDFNRWELKQMKEEGFDSESLKGRAAFAKEYDMVEKLKEIPHQWAEYKDQIIDFTAQSQFVDSGLASDTDRSRYSYGKRKLTESSRSAPLYHFTSGVVEILKTNTLGVDIGAGRRVGGKPGEIFVSLTRDPHHLFNYKLHCLILDQAKLAQRYKFKKIFGDVRDKKHRESEERIYQAITPLNNYLKAIVVTRIYDDFLKQELNYIFNWAKKHNIPVYEAPRNSENSFIVGQFANGWVHKTKLLDLDAMLKS